MEKWHDYPKEKPNEFKNYICLVSVPADSGKCYKCYRMLSWNNGSQKWMCNKIIVEKWIKIPYYEEDEDE